MTSCPILLLLGSLTFSFNAASPPAPRQVKSQDAKSRTAKHDRAALEKQFQDSLAGVVLKGSWRMTRGDGLNGKAPLGEARDEKYTILSANKVDGDWWLIRARLEFADANVVLPVRVRVVWSTDTPVITVDDQGIPGIGTYSARVMIYRNFYAGTWFGKGYGGVMSGQIVKQRNAGDSSDDPTEGAESGAGSPKKSRE